MVKASTSTSRVSDQNLHRFSDTHQFEKPNDVRALELMDRAAARVMEELGDVVLGYGESDEYRYVRPLIRADAAF